MPKRLLILNVLLGGVGLFCVAFIVQRAATRIAYLEAPLTKRVGGYRIGDTIAGGGVEAITADHVLISRPDGNMDVRLRDPPKPRPAPPAQPAVPGQPPVPGVPGVVPPTPTQPMPQVAPIPPRALSPQQPVPPFQIGRASCRERV